MRTRRSYVSILHAITTSLSASIALNIIVAANMVLADPMPNPTANPNPNTPSCGDPNAAQLTAELSVAPTTVRLGQRVEVVLTVTNTGGGRGASNIVPTIQANVGADSVVLSDNPSGISSLAKGATVSFTWTLSVFRDGSVSLTATATGSDPSTCLGGERLGIASASLVVLDKISGVIGQESEGTLVAAPNILNLSSSSGNIVLYFKGRPNATVEVAIYDSVGRNLGKRPINLNNLGIGSVVYARDGWEGKRPEVGSYWALARAEGGLARIGFTVKAR